MPRPQCSDDPNALTCLGAWLTAKQNGEKKSASSPREKRFPANVLFTRPLTNRQRLELQRLRDTPDSEIDLSDAPPFRPLQSDIEVGRFYKSIREMQTRPRAR